MLIKVSPQRRSFGNFFVGLAHGLDIVLGYFQITAQGSQCIHEIQGLIRQQDANAGVLDDVGDFAVAELEVDGHGNGTQRRCAHIGKDEVGAVAGEDTHAVAFTHAGFIEPVAAVFYSLLGFFIGKAALMVHNGHSLRFSLHN